jgi:hypothetical protein
VSHFINAVDEDQCVFLSHEGEMPAFEILAAAREANGVLDQRQWNRLVVDVTQLHSVLAPVELFNLAQGLSRQVSRRVRVALVVRPNQARHANLVEKIARNGRVFLTYFLDPERAIGWVKQNGLPGHDSKRQESGVAVAASR